MKKNNVMILLAMFCFLLAGCSQLNISKENADKIQVVTTVFPPYDFAQKIGGDRVEVKMLLKPGMESHSYEPSPRDMIAITESDLFLYAGGESDVWISELLEEEERVNSHALLSWVEPLYEEHTEGMQIKHDHAHDAEHDEVGHTSEKHEGELHDADHHDDHEAVQLSEEEYDEHVWTSPQNAMVLVERITEELCTLAPEHADYFKKNAESYLQELKKLDAAFTEVTERADRNVLVFGDRFPLLYFTKTYGLEYYAAFPGCSSETEPSAKTIAFLTETVKKEQIPVIFYMELSNGKVAEAIAEATGAETACFYAVHNVSADDLAAGEDYLSLMYRNLESLEKALCQ